MQKNLKKIATRGEAIYHNKIMKTRPLAKGKFAAIDIESKDYFIGDTLTEAYQKAKKKYPSHKFHFVRIGYPALVSLKHHMHP